jgi:transposase
LPSTKPTSTREGSRDSRGRVLGHHEAWSQDRSISEIARETRHDRKTIRRLLRQGGPRPRAPRQVTSKLDPFREYVVRRMVADKVTNAEVLYDEIREQGDIGGRSILWEFLRPLRRLVADDRARCASSSVSHHAAAACTAS